jgi:hypothetical protein
MARFRHKCPFLHLTNIATNIAAYEFLLSLRRENISFFIIIKENNKSNIEE